MVPGGSRLCATSKPLEPYEQEYDLKRAKEGRLIQQLLLFAAIMTDITVQLSYLEDPLEWNFWFTSKYILMAASVIVTVATHKLENKILMIKINHCLLILLSLTEYVRTNSEYFQRKEEQGPYQITYLYSISFGIIVMCVISPWIFSHMQLMTIMVPLIGVNFLLKYYSEQLIVVDSQDFDDVMQTFDLGFALF